MLNNKPAKRNKVYDNSGNNSKSIDVSSQLDLDPCVIDNLDQKLLELLVRGYENKQVATEVNTPLSTIQRRIRNLFENQYVSRKNVLNYKKLGLRKGYLQISLRGNNAHMVAQRICGLRGITSISEVTGIFDIISTCVFRDTNELFSILENIKTIEGVNKVVSSEEVRSIDTNRFISF